MGPVRHDFVDQVTRLALSDGEFRAALEADPRRAIEDRFMVDLPQNVTVQLLHEDEGSVYLVLPGPPGSDRAVSDQELAGVAGGWRPSAGGTCTSCAQTCNCGPP